MRQNKLANALLRKLARIEARTKAAGDKLSHLSSAVNEVVGGLNHIQDVYASKAFPVLDERSNLDQKGSRPWLRAWAIWTEVWASIFRRAMCVKKAQRPTD